ncbi:sigma-54-dependent transcriptional regulator [Bacteroidota bacterium]
MKQNKGKILIVDDNQSILSSLELLLKYEFDLIEKVKNPNLIPGYIDKGIFDIILLDMNFSAGISTGNEGIFWLKNILEKDPLAIVIMITAYGDINLAVKAIKEGATDFITKPWDSEKLVITLKNALKLRNSKVEVESLKQKQKDIQKFIGKPDIPIIGSSIAMKNIQDTINKVAGTDANVLILGENGTGKELVAREIHRRSNRKNEVFIPVDMGSLSESLFESELFGHKKGSFTDAKEDRKGRFETASGGTLFLDEIGNVSMSLQSKLLTALQNKEIIPLGSNEPIPIDIRLISATNKNPDKLVEDNLFRDDLLYRINTILVELPSLRDRGEDIILLTDYFLKLFAKKYEKPLLKISSKAVDKLMKHVWPGNVRELRHSIEKAIILSDSATIKPEDFAFRPGGQAVNTDDDDSLNLSEVERNAIAKSILKNKGVISEAAKELGISRTTLYTKMEKYSL